MQEVRAFSKCRMQVSRQVGQDAMLMEHILEGAKPCIGAVDIALPAPRCCLRVRDHAQGVMPIADPCWITAALPGGKLVSQRQED